VTFQSKNSPWPVCDSIYLITHELMNSYSNYI